jgi:HlyD family secretion protein
MAGHRNRLFALLLFALVNQGRAAEPLVRATGTVQAVRQISVLVPSITGQSGRITLTRLIPNGMRVKAGDVLAEFDSTQQLDNARDARARLDDLEHQVAQRVAQNRSDAEQRGASLAQAEGDVAKAELQIRKAPVISEIDRLTNAARLRMNQSRVASLKKSGSYRDAADAAALRILELRRDRQKVALERALGNIEKLVLRAPLAGMVAHENTYRGGSMLSMGPAQEGDQLYPGFPMVRIFDASEMEVVAMVGEPDGAILRPGASAEVTLDAYPDLKFRARYYSSSPVASSGYGSPIKAFTARFRLEGADPHLLPDLSAAVTIHPPAEAADRGRRP